MDAPQARQQCRIHCRQILGVSAPCKVAAGQAADFAHELEQRGRRHFTLDLVEHAEHQNDVVTGKERPFELDRPELEVDHLEFAVDLGELGEPMPGGIDAWRINIATMTKPRTGAVKLIEDVAAIASDVENRRASSTQDEIR